MFYGRATEGSIYVVYHVTNSRELFPKQHILDSI